MKFTAKFTNFGKLNDATLHFNDLTVIAGNNSTGKSYVSRTLYCIFDALAKDPYIEFYSDAIKKFTDDLLNLDDYEISTHDTYTYASIDECASDLLDKIEQIRTQILSDNAYPASSDANTKEAYFMKLLQPLVKEKKDFLEHMNDFINQEKQTFFDGILEEEWRDVGSVEDIDGSKNWDKAFMIFDDLDDLLKMSLDNKKDIGYVIHISDILKDNFQVRRLESLLGRDKTQSATIEITFDEGKINLSIDPYGELTGEVKIADLSFVSNIMYLSSPTQWLLQEAISHMPVRKAKGNKRYLGGVPKHIHDSYATLGAQNISEPRDAMKNIVKYIEESIKGTIKYNADHKELNFVEEFTEDNQQILREDLFGKIQEEEGVSLLLTASGIVQLGMLGFFINNRTIDKGTTLFMDEPEVHLHTAWQERIMQVLYALKQNGVKVVITTHSPTIMQKLELSVKRDKSHREVALNLCSNDGKFGDGISDFKTINREIALSMNEVPFRMAFR